MKLIASIFFYCGIFAAGDQGGEIVRLSKHVGFTLDAEENLYYEVFTTISNFKNAQFFEINNDKIEARISYLEFTRIKISKKLFTMKEFIDIQLRINKMPKITNQIRESFKKNLTYLRTKDILSNIPIGQFIILNHVNGTKLKGTLLAYSKDKLFIQTPFSVKAVKVSKMEKISYREDILDKPQWKMKIYTIAALMGLLSMETWNSQTSPDWGYKWHNRIMGATFGLLAGAEVYNTSMILLTNKTYFNLTEEELKK